MAAVWYRFRAELRAKWRGLVGLGLIAGLADHASTDVGRSNVLHGRLPSPGARDEVLVNPRFASRHGLTVGDRFDAVLLGGNDFEAIDAAGLGERATATALNRGDYGERVRLDVVGVGVDPADIVVDEGFEQALLTATPAFVAAHPDADAGFYGLFVRLKRGAADLPASRGRPPRWPRSASSWGSRSVSSQGASCGARSATSSACRPIRPGLRRRSRCSYRSCSSL
ncbi:MAG: hypothetical protein ACHQIG_05115 [Acidimicrobiia bacterium]